MTDLDLSPIAKKAIKDINRGTETARSIHSPKNKEAVKVGDLFTDSTNAERIARDYGNRIRYDHRRGRWLIWNQHRWEPDVNGVLNRLALQSIRKLYKESSEVNDLGYRKSVSRWCIQSESRMRIDAAISILKSLHPVTDSGSNWDNIPFLLSCRNGIVELKTGQIRNGKQEDRITMVTNVNFDPGAKCPRWKQFIDQIFAGDTKLINYIRKSLGYTLTGDTKEQVVYFCYGQGQNGKSVFFSILRDVLHDFAYASPASLFQRNASTTNSNDLASIEHKRFLLSGEVLSTAKINEQRIKGLSGGDQMTARFLYREYFSFYPECKVWLFVNHKPSVEDDSFGFWRRVRLIPFNQVFKGKDENKNLIEELRAELPGILNWLLTGCLLWQKKGLEPTPDSVIEESQSYRIENDPLAEFILDECEEGNDKKIKASDFYKVYRAWAEARGLDGKDFLSQKTFGIRMTDKFLKKARDGRFHYFGVGLKELVDSQPPKIVPEVDRHEKFPKLSYISSRIGSIGKNDRLSTDEAKSISQPSTQPSVKGENDDFQTIDEQYYQDSVLKSEDLEVQDEN